MKYMKYSGFTLIELVIVIVILGILAAAALPRFSDLSTDARVATINGLAGGIRSAAAITHGTQLAQGRSPGETVTLEGTAIGMSAGYPLATSISATLIDFSGFTAANVSPATTPPSVDFMLGGRTECRVRYAQPATSPGLFTVTVTSTGANPC